MHSTGFLIFSLWLMMVAVQPITGLIHDVEKCLVDYSPCNCEQTSDLKGWTVICNQVPIAKIQPIFNKTKARDLSSFILMTTPTETATIPADLLGASRTEELHIVCGGSYNLMVDDNAFRSSKNLTSQFFIRDCDLKKLPNFNFLSSFLTLARITIDNSANFNSFQGLPSKSPIYNIIISDSRGFEKLTEGPNVTLSGLRYLHLYRNGLDDVAAAKILKTLATSSKGSLEELRLNDNKLTRIPDMISSFTKLNDLVINRNNIASIKSRSLAFSSPINHIHLGNNPITSIEANAFGAEIYRLVYLPRSKLKRFDSFVFQTILEGMAREEGSAIQLEQNPIECDCHLAWLIVHKRNLLPLIEGGMCSNSTSFQDLKPEGLKSCPAFTCPTGTNGNFPNPSSCTSYYTCTAGKSTLVECPAGNGFSRSTLKCDLFKNMPVCK